MLTIPTLSRTMSMVLETLLPLNTAVERQQGVAHAVCAHNAGQIDLTADVERLGFYMFMIHELGHNNSEFIQHQWDLLSSGVRDGRLHDDTCYAAGELDLW